jgi:hypothetical protein
MAHDDFVLLDGFVEDGIAQVVEQFLVFVEMLRVLRGKNVKVNRTTISSEGLAKNTKTHPTKWAT